MKKTTLGYVLAALIVVAGIVMFGYALAVKPNYTGDPTIHSK